MFFARLKAKRGLLKTYFLPLIFVFTLVNSELRNFSSDKVTPKLLIINNLKCHLSLVTFAFTLSLVVLRVILCKILSDLASIRAWLSGLPLTGGPIKIIHELRRFLRLLLLNINYLRYQFFIKYHAEKYYGF